MYNPFKPITENIYDINNIKKVYDIFPSSLRRAQLSSNELVEFLRSQLFDRDITIEELQRQLAQIADFSGTRLDEELANLGFDDISSLIDSLLSSEQQAARRTQLEAQGYVKIADTELYVLVDTAPSDIYEFNINHTDENAGFFESDIKSPFSIEFKNIGEDRIYFIKQETWLNDDDGYLAGNRSPSYTGKRFGVNTNDGFMFTNAYKFDEFPLLDALLSSIGAGETKSTRISLNYKSEDAYTNAGLSRDSQTNTWYGEMQILASTSTTATTADLRELIPTSIGKMRLFRDKN